MGRTTHHRAVRVPHLRLHQRALRVRDEATLMPRLMSVSLTEQAVVERRKTVTRRAGWTFLRAGDRLTLCRKVMGRRKGEPLVRVAEVQVISAWPEALSSITPSDVAAEGFPDWTPRSSSSSSAPAGDVSSRRRFRRRAPPDMQRTDTLR